MTQIPSTSMTSKAGQTITFQPYVPEIEDRRSGLAISVDGTEVLFLSPMDFLLFKQQAQAAMYAGAWHAVTMLVGGLATAESPEADQ